MGPPPDDVVSHEPSDGPRCTATGVCARGVRVTDPIERGCGAFIVWT
jgi:hypothetical protein